MSWCVVNTCTSANSNSIPFFVYCVFFPFPFFPQNSLFKSMSNIRQTRNQPNHHSVLGIPRFVTKPSSKQPVASSAVGSSRIQRSLFSANASDAGPRETNATSTKMFYGGRQMPNAETRFSQDEYLVLVICVTIRTMKISHIMTTIRLSTLEAVTDHATMIEKNMTVTQACYTIVKIAMVQESSGTHKI